MMRTQLNLKIVCAFSLLALISCDGPYREPLPRCSISPGINEYGNGGKYGITYYTELEKAKQCAASTGRNMLVMFTYYKYMACEGSDWRILRKSNVRELIDEQFVLVVLYVDDDAPLDVPEYFEAQGDSVSVSTVGQKNSAILAERFNSNGSPFYVVIDTSFTPLAPGLGYVKEDSVVFEEMLQSALRKADSLK